MKDLKLVLIFVLVTLVTIGGETASSRSKKKSNDIFANMGDYNVSQLQVGVQGTRFLKVSGFGKKLDDAILQVKKNAIHASLFRGVPAISTIPEIPPLITDSNARIKHAEYFECFFEISDSDTESFIAFVKDVSEGDVPSGANQIRVKGGYRVNLYLQVLYDDLRRKLEKDEIIRPLGDIFK